MGLMTRRRATMMTRQVEPPTGYVMDGLTVWLDGINKGDTPIGWEDLISGVAFTSSTATFLSDCIELSGNQAMNTPNNSVIGDQLVTVGTIEVVCAPADTTKFSVVYFAPLNGKLCFAFYPSDGNLYVIWATGNSSQPMIPVTAQGGTYSISAGDCYYNGTRIAGRGGNNNVSFSGTSRHYIGCRTLGINDAYFKGRIYSIRIYNRHLTAQEIRNNYLVDRSRFSLFNS